MKRAWTVGVDFGGTNIKLGLVDARGQIVHTHVLATADCHRPNAFVEAVGWVADGFARAVNVRTSGFAGIGVGAPGQIDAERGVVRALMNVPGWRDVPLARLLARRLGCRCAVDNDAKLFVLAEWRLGAGRRTRDLVGLTLGTGVGGGVIAGGRLLRGASNTAGEFGHIVVDPRGRRCGCGRRGCLEAEVGAAAIVAMAVGHGDARTPELVARAARRGDRTARDIWRRVGSRLGMALADIVNALNPQRIVIGGGLANAWTLFAPTMIAVVRCDAISQATRSLRIVRGRLGNSAGILGAAVLIWGENTKEDFAD